MEEIKLFDLTIKLDHVFLIFLLLTAYLRFSNATLHNLWIDESRDAYDAYFLSRNPLDIVNIPAGMHPPLFTYIIAIFYWVLGFGDFAARMVPPFLGTLIPLIIYVMGSKIFGKKTALLATMLFSTAYLPVFLSTRILTDIAIAVVFSLALLSFYLGFELNQHIEIFGKKINYTILSGIFLGLALLTKETSYLIPVILVVYLLLTRKFDFGWLKKKELWVAALLAVLLFLPWAYRNVVVSGDPVELKKWVGQNTAQDFTRIPDFFYYFKAFPSFFGLPETLLLALGLILILLKPTKQGLFLFSWIAIILLFFSWYGQKEPRFLILLFPAFYLVIGNLVESLKTFGPSESKTFGALFVVVLVIALLNFPVTKATVEAKAKGYSMLKEAGQFVGSRTAETDVVIAGSTTTIKFYSLRETHGIPPNQTALLELINQKKAKFIVIDTWEYTQPPYIFEFLRNRTDLFQPAAVFDDKELSKDRFVGSVVYSIRT